jgi:tetratricopeptide (TPR) repeat protein
MQAEKLIAKGDGILAKKIYLGNKLKDASACYEEAAGIYRNQKQHTQCAEAYQKLGDVLEKMGQANPAASAYKEAANQYDASALFDGMGYDNCIEMLRKAASIYSSSGKNGMAASVFKELAEKLEAEEEEGAWRGALLAWREAYDRYETDNAFPNMNNCLVKIAELSANLKDFKQSASTWDELLYADWNREKKNSASSTMTRLSVQKYVINATLCRLAALKNTYDKEDVEIVQMGFTEKNDVGNNFEKSREYQLLQGLCKALELKDKQLFAKAIKIADEAIKLNEWTMNVLVSIKKVMEESMMGLEDPDLT